MMTKNEMSRVNIDTDTLIEIGCRLRPKDLLVLRYSKLGKETVQTFMEYCIYSPSIFFRYVENLNINSMNVFRKMLLLSEMWPSLEQIDNEEFLNTCSDPQLLQYAVITYDTTRIPLARLNEWLLNNFPDDSQDTIKKITNTPFALNLLIIALFRKYSILRDNLAQQAESKKILQNIKFVLKERAQFQYLHQKFLNLSRAELSKTDLTKMILTDAILSGAILSGATLNGTTLTRAILAYANMTKTSLFGATLKYSNLFGVDLSGVNLSMSDLFGTTLSEANLKQVNLFGANTKGVCLYDVNFDKTTQFSLDSPDKEPDFISNEISTPQILAKSLSDLIDKTKNHPQLDGIKKAVVRQTERLIEECDDATQKELLYQEAYHHPFIATHRALGSVKDSINSSFTFFGRKGLMIPTDSQKKLETWWENLKSQVREREHEEVVEEQENVKFCLRSTI